MSAAGRRRQHASRVLHPESAARRFRDFDAIALIAASACAAPTTSSELLSALPVSPSKKTHSMIAGTLAQCSRYASLSPRFGAAFDFLRSLSANLPLGRHDIASDDCFALVQAYTTKPLAAAKFEAHRNYVDIQFLQSGRETLLWTPLTGLAETQAYDSEKDYALFAAPANATPLRLRAGEFTIFYPEDAHAPCLELDGPCEVRKIVVKVRV